MTKEIRTDVPDKKDETLVKKKRSGLRHKFKEIRIEILIFNTYETRETTVHKKLSRRSTL